MAFWPDIVFNLLPGFGLLSTCTSLVYLFAMRTLTGGGCFLAAVFTLRAMDLLMGLSLFYAGFHGILLSVYGTDEQMPPIRCLFTAVHLHVWVFTDSAQMLLLALLCADQFISVVWTKRHREFSEYYFNFVALLLLLLLACASFIPAWLEPILVSENSSILISSYCAMPDALGNDFYAIQLEVRKWFPVIGTAALCLLIVLICILQFSQKGRFKWSDNNSQSTRFFLLILCRSLMLAASVHIPLINYRVNRPFDADDWHFLQEIMIRAWQALLFGLVNLANEDNGELFQRFKLEPLLDLLLLPQFPAKISEFFNLNEVKRTWQSADDPPAPNRSVGTSGWDIFGSFHSTTGNIIGDAGIPMELNADVQRSVSFYYKDDD